MGFAPTARAAFAFLLVGCGRAEAPPTATSPAPSVEQRSRHGANASPATAAAPGGEGPGGEMLLGLAVPPLSEGNADPQTPVKDSSATAPTGRKELLAAFDEAMIAGRADEAIATADVLALLYPDDGEILERRGRALLASGDAEGGKRDLLRCCELGRAGCCGEKAP